MERWIRRNLDDIKHETIKEYVDELYKYNFEVLFVGIV